MSIIRPLIRRKSRTQTAKRGGDALQLPVLVQHRAKPPSPALHRIASGRYQGQIRRRHHGVRGNAVNLLLSFGIRWQRLFVQSLLRAIVSNDLGNYFYRIEGSGRIFS